MSNNGSNHASSSAAHDLHRRSRSSSTCNSEKPVIRPSKNGSYEMASCSSSPLHKNSFSLKKHFDGSNQKASLEKDIEKLQLHLQQEKSMRMVLEKAMGRASSTLSPGHRHFSTETKELIAEIELLEKEVANREKQVLSLYRNIFDQCVSRPGSERSSVISSPLHEKKESRKHHPRIISNAFCSSFPVRKLHTRSTSVGDSGKQNLLQSKTRQTSLFNCRDKMDVDNSCKNNVKTLMTSRASVPPRTLKEHLHECPSNLAAEMVRCMAAVYYSLRTSPSPKTEQSLSTSSILPQLKVKSDRDWSTIPAIEISWISTEKSKLSRATYAINSYRILVEQLEKVNVCKMDSTAQIAFWINLYNSLVMHAYLAFGIPQNSLRRLALFHKAAYNVGGLVVSASTIEQSIFCCRTPRMGQWLEIVLSTGMKKRSAEERKLIGSNYGLQSFQPLVCFALCTGAYSDPLLSVYTAHNIKEELEAAKKQFIESNVVIKKSKSIYLPKLAEKYAKEAGIRVDDIVDWVLENVDVKIHSSIQKCRENRPKKKIKWLPYDSRFRYLFSKELLEKPV